MKRFFASAPLAALLFFGCTKVAPTAENTLSACSDSSDNDQDGAPDCNDIECIAFPHCQPVLNDEDCIGGADEDQDGAIDCSDPDCTDGNPANSANDDACLTVEDCTNLDGNGDPLDDDGDGEANCADLDCLGAPACKGIATCGDGAVNQVIEECDGTDLDGNTCVDLGFSGGALGCTASCNFDTAACTAPVTCGNGALDAGEACDGANLGGQSCVSQGFGGGTLSCASNCQFDTSLCTAPTTCGDGVINPGTEQCDGANLGGQTCQSRGFSGGTLACGGTCQFDTSSCTNVTAENCSDGIDNDGDGQVDCNDSNCIGAANCVVTGNGTCASPFVATPNSTHNNNTTAGADNNLSAGAGGCLIGAGAPDQVYVFTAPANGTVTLNLTSTADLGLYVRAADSISPAECDPGFEVDCVDGVGSGTEIASGTMNAAGVIYIVVDGCEQFCVGATSGAYTLTVNFQ